MFDFVRGDPKKPRGSLLLYAHTPGKNSITSDAKFIVCNVVVSFVSANDDHFPVVAFPPTILDSEQELSMLLHLNSECDVMRLEDFAPPLYQEAKHYVRTRIKSFNTVVGQYVEMCREHFQLRVKESCVGELSSLSHKFFTKFPNMSGMPEISEVPDACEESLYIDQLEQYIKVYETVSRKTHLHFHKIMRIMEDKYPYYDLANFARAIGVESKINTKEKKSQKELTPAKKSNPKLAMLYLRKFRAIEEEKYEEAAKIQNSIRTIEANTEKCRLDRQAQK